LALLGIDWIYFCMQEKRSMLSFPPAREWRVSGLVRWWLMAGACYFDTELG
jgi:hypothetical protein